MFTREEMLTVDGSVWVHPATGETRVYLNGWERFIKLEVWRYKTGNISYAELNGEKISNSRAGKILCARVWWSDVDGKVHVTGRSVLAAGFLDELISGLRAAVNAVRV